MSESLKLTLGFFSLVAGFIVCLIAFFMDKRKVLRVFLMGLGVAGVWAGRSILLHLS